MIKKAQLTFWITWAVALGLYISFLYTAMLNSLIKNNEDVIVFYNILFFSIITSTLFYLSLRIKERQYGAALRTALISSFFALAFFKYEQLHFYMDRLPTSFWDLIESLIFWNIIFTLLAASGIYRARYFHLKGETKKAKNLLVFLSVMIPIAFIYLNFFAKF